MLITLPIFLDSPVRQPRLYIKQAFVFHSSLVTHNSSLFPASTRLSGKTPRLSAKHADLSDTTSRIGGDTPYPGHILPGNCPKISLLRTSSIQSFTPLSVHGEGLGEGFPLRMFPSSTTKRGRVLENSRNFRQKSPILRSFLRINFQQKSKRTRNRRVPLVLLSAFLASVRSLPLGWRLSILLEP